MKGSVMMKKSIIFVISVTLSVLIFVTLPFSSFATEYITKYVYSDELVFNNKYHIETWDSNGNLKYDREAELTKHVTVYDYAFNGSSLSNGVDHSNFFKWLYNQGFSTFQYGYTPNTPSDMYSGRIGSGLWFREVLDRFDGYLLPEDDVNSVTLSFRVVFYLEGVFNSSSLPTYSMNFASQYLGSTGENLIPVSYNTFSNSYSGTGVVATYSLNLAIGADLDSFLNSFCNLSFKWTGFPSSTSSSYGNNQVFIFAFDTMNFTIETGEVTLSNVNNTIEELNKNQHITNGKLDGIQESIAGVDQELSQDVIFNGSFGNVDYADPDELDVIFNDKYSSFNSDFSSYWAQNFIGDSNLLVAIRLYGNMLTLGFTKLTFMTPIFSVLLLFGSINMIMGIVGVARGVRVNSERQEQIEERRSYRERQLEERRAYHARIESYYRNRRR